MRQINLSRDKTCVVDQIDYVYISTWKWSFLSSGYAVRQKRDRGKSSLILMHREITQRTLGRSLLPKEQVDHIDGDGLNNQRANLRVCSHSQNLANGGPRARNRSGYRGVCLDKTTGRWVADLQVNRERYRLGRFSTARDAALAWNVVALEKLGEFAYQNLVEAKP